MYDFKSRVRYSEVNSERQLTLPALIDYLQNCCTFQSEDMNIGVEYLEQHHAAWVLSSWEIVMNRYPKLAEHITVSTWPYSFKGFYGYRNFTIKDEAGEICAFANSVWVYMDTATMRPVRIAKEVQDAYIPVMDEAIQYEWADRKIRIEGTPVEKEPVLVQRFHIDTNHHMNNGKYILVAEEYLPENFKTESIRVEYKKAAVIGDMLYPEVYEQQNGVTIVLADAQKVPYAIMQFRGKYNVKIRTVSETYNCKESGVWSLSRGRAGYGETCASSGKTGSGECKDGG